MTYIFIRAIYGVWVIGGAVFLINAVSALMFSKLNKGKKARALFATVLFCAVWPLAIFSAEGRRIIFGRFNKL